MLKQKSDMDSMEKDGTIEKKSWLVRIGLFFLELIKIAVLAGITIWVIRTFLFKPFYVRGQSMFPTFQEKDYLIIDELSYRFRSPKRGEVVVFRAPTNDDDKEYYLKRIVGLPGERIKIEQGKVIVYNSDNLAGKVLDEYYLKDTTSGTVDVQIGLDQFFVLGDNRSASYDSRGFGPVNKEDVVGRTWFRGLPMHRISTFYVPDYNL